MIDGLTLAEAGEIFRYWEDNPPPHLLLQTIARLLGWQPAGPPPTASIADVAAAPPPGLAVVPAGSLDIPPAIFDLDTLRVRNRTRASQSP